MADRFSSIDWDDLRVFLALARAGTLRGAARALGVNHATVTRRLGQLEAGLETRLFDRRPDGLVPTQAGEDLLVSARRVEQEMQVAHDRLAGHDLTPAGLVRLSLPPALMQGLLAAELATFCRQFPRIELDIDLTDRFSDLNWREADVSLRMAHEVEDDVVGRRLLRYAKSVYAAPGYLDATPRDRLTWIGWGPDEPHPQWTRDTPFADVPVRHRLFGHVAQVQAAKAGLGLSMLPCFVGDPEAGLVRATDAAPAADRSIWLLLHRALHRTARVRALVDFLAAAVARHRGVFLGLKERS